MKQSVVSFTDSHSLHLRLFDEGGYETFLEIFYDFDPNESDQIQAVITILKDGKDVIRNYGLMKDMISLYLKTTRRGK